MLKNKISPEKLSSYTLYALIGITLFVFILFYVAGSETVGDIADQTEAPVLTGTLIAFLFVMMGIAAVAVVAMLCRTLMLRKQNKQ
ncbi:MAG: hypothetical protein HUK08_09105 [Bacteroidaceae bacterium]|nr:hypothetical protein [Bacteroidaceae bacterium]